MEISVEERLTGRELRDRILARYGSREALERRAQGEREVEARDDLFTLRLFDEDPSRLDANFTDVAVTRLDPAVLAELTPHRLALIDLVARHPEGIPVGAIARELGRTPQDVEADLALLAEWGFIDMGVGGGEPMPRPHGNVISITLRPPGAES